MAVRRLAAASCRSATTRPRRAPSHDPRSPEGPARRVRLRRVPCCRELTLMGPWFPYGESATSTTQTQADRGHRGPHTSPPHCPNWPPPGQLPSAIRTLISELEFAGPQRGPTECFLRPPRCRQRQDSGLGPRGQSSDHASAQILMVSREPGDLRSPRTTWRARPLRVPLTRLPAPPSKV